MTATLKKFDITYLSIYIYMKIIKSPADAQKYFLYITWRRKTIGFVPTMGALHDGHVSLIRRARRENDVVAVSIFVNPTQFGPREDFKKYPRPFKRDIAICRREKVDVVFAPSPVDMYPEGFDTEISVGNMKSRISDILCGASRPGHFKGVATVVAKLFNIVCPARAYFGQKDYQQLKIIERMAEDLNFSVKIIPCPTVRESSGLAMSSRNIYLSADEKRLAPAIYKIISGAKKDPSGFLGLKHNCSISAKMLENEIARRIKESVKGSEIDYVSVLNAGDLTHIEKLSPRISSSLWRILVAVRMKSGTRLIDNV